MNDNVESTTTEIKCLVDFLKISTESIIFSLKKDEIMPTEQELRNARDGLHIVFDLLKHKINAIEDSIVLDNKNA